MEAGTYYSINTSFEGDLFKEKGSKFYSYIFPVNSEEEVGLLIKDVKTNHPKARHWCYAWSLGVDDLKWRVNDDGEPSNSAGQPIYGQILSANLKNVLIVVVRYFGGVKLGVGGLITAYRSSAKLAVEASEIVLKSIEYVYELNFKYEDMNKVLRVVKNNRLKIQQQSFDVDCCLRIVIPKVNLTKVQNQFTQLRCLTNFQIKE